MTDSEAPRGPHPLLAILDVKRVCRPYGARVSVRRALGVVLAIDIRTNTDIEIAVNDDETIYRVGLGMWNLYSDDMLTDALEDVANASVADHLESAGSR